MSESGRGVCDHCGLALPRAAVSEQSGAATLRFCCSGCLLVHRLVGGTGEGARADWFLARLGLATLLSGNVMIFQSLNYFGNLEQVGVSAADAASWIMMGCALATFLLLGVPMLRTAWRSLGEGHMTLEALIGAGALAAIGYSTDQTFRHGRALYYDSGTMLLVFVTLGHYLEAEARRRALALLEPALNVWQRTARVQRDGADHLVPPDQVRPGECVRVLATEEIPVDGTVADGISDVSEPQLTGEWRPRTVTEGAKVMAGSVSIDGEITVRASTAGLTLRQKVEALAASARQERANVEVAAERAVRLFVPAVMLVAVATFGYFALHGAPDRGLQCALAVLVVACPCALGIATPLATTIALSRALGNGVLIRSGRVIEALAGVRAVAFDKTGTLTASQPRVTIGPQHEAARSTVLESLLAAAAIEEGLLHPYAIALRAAARALGGHLSRAEHVRVTPGCGVEGLVDGRGVMAGKLEWLRARGVDVRAAEGVAESGRPAVHIALQGRWSAALPISDPLRPEAQQVIARLHRMGLSCHVLSGDDSAVVAEVARALRFDSASGNLSPEDKPRHVERLRAVYGPVAMVGDGINDAAALARSDAGIAFGSAADLARRHADVTVLADDLGAVPRMLALARRTRSVIRQNLVWAFIYNIVGICLAAAGLLRPVIAALAMVLSSLCVVANSVRLRRGSEAMSAAPGQS